MGSHIAFDYRLPTGPNIRTGKLTATLFVLFLTNRSGNHHGQKQDPGTQARSIPPGS